ncbi:hypothetical protein FKV68_25780 (plasmid) [Sinorhizobium mexicanum]|uniref:Uncharacterized protein n=1 Tax=Sinorhizobium mexicanum TaxID=375549 RepID=A0A859QF60_9HYPH|nr:hypothetical protein FKV68_25780 [Sinorhizobium mexicanum]
MGGIPKSVLVRSLQRRASQTRKGRFSPFKCCMFSSLNRLRFKETCSRTHKALDVEHSPQAAPAFVANPARHVDTRVR